MLFYKQFDRLHNFRLLILVKPTKGTKKSAFLCIFVCQKLLTIKALFMYNKPKSTCVYFTFAMLMLGN